MVAGPELPVDAAVDGEAESALAAAGVRDPPEPPEINWARASPIDGVVAEIVVNGTPTTWHCNDGGASLIRVKNA
jgi:hypothetical protein